jgi:hypothetical protein
MTVNISLGCALVAGRNRVPNPAAGMMAFLTFMFPPSNQLRGHEMATKICLI